MIFVYEYQFIMTQINFKFVKFIKLVLISIIVD